MAVDRAGDATRVSLPHPEIIHTLKEGDTLLVDDGKVRVKVLSTSDTSVICRVEVGGTISDRKGVNTPSIVLPISPLTPKDRADLQVCLRMPQ
jgi:pyruvate kinase